MSTVCDGHNSASARMAIFGPMLEILVEIRITNFFLKKKGERKKFLILISFRIKRFTLAIGYMRDYYYYQYRPEALATII